MTIVLTHHGQRNGLSYADNTAKNKNGENRNYPAFEWDFKNPMLEKGYMNSTATNSGCWDGSKRRQWIPALVESLPSYLVNKDFNVLTAETYNGTTLKTTTQKASIRAIGEITNADSNGFNNTEKNALEQVEYYMNPENTYGAWTRSADSNNESAFWMVSNSNGTSSAYLANAEKNIKVFGCLG